MPSTSDTLRRLQDWDLTLCASCNRIHRHPLLIRLFRACSRLGDGVFWYSLMLALPLADGYDGVVASLHMAVVGLICVTLYKWLKGKTVRPRPYTRHPGIHRITAPLDQYSFPSGHTLHAIAFTLVVLYYYPLLAWLVIPFSLLVALSRPALGLHYPSDVLAGGTIGALISLGSFLLLG